LLISNVGPRSSVDRATAS